MTPPSQPSSLHEDTVIQAFMRDMEDAESAEARQAVLSRYVAAHPERSEDFQAAAQGMGLLGQVAPALTKPAHCLRPGDRLGEFEVIDYVDKGGMGEVYKAKQLTLDRRVVALKVIRADRVSPQTRDRFLHEQRVLSRMHHTNIVPVFAAGQADNLQYFAMQYIEGATLAHVVRSLRETAAGSTPSLGKIANGLVKTGRPFPDPDASTIYQPSATPAPTPPASGTRPGLTIEYCRSLANVVAEAADALESVHRQGILHRDVKPSNLMIEGSEKLWVIDVGLAGLVGGTIFANGPPAPGASPTLTETGAIPGTPAYMAPEAFDGKPEPRSDVWSLGVTMYELLTHCRPFQGKTEDALMTAIKNDVPERPSKCADNLPPDLEAICLKCLRKDPTARYASAGQLADDLRHWLRGEPTAARRPWPWRRFALWAKRNPGWAAFVLVGLLSVVVLSAAFSYIAHLRGLEERTRREAESAHAASAEQQIQTDAMISLEQQRNLAERSSGWRERLWANVVKVTLPDSKLRLRDQATSFLMRLDASVSRTLDGPATWLAVDSGGRRLLIGGSNLRDHERPTRVRDLRTDAEAVSTQRGVGPVAFRGNVPLQLVPPTSERRLLMLWDVDKDRAMEEFGLADGMRPVLPEEVIGTSLGGLALSADASACALLVEFPDEKKRPEAVLGDRKKVIVLWRSGDKRPVGTIPVTDNSTLALAFSPDGRLLAVGDDEGKVRVWTAAAKPALIAEFQLEVARVTGLAFRQSPSWRNEGRRKPGSGQGWLLAAGNASGTIAVWDLEDRSQLMQTHETAHEVFALAFSPDGATLASTGRNEGRLWDVATGRMLLRLFPGKTPRNWQAGIVFSPDGRWLAVSSLPVFSPHGEVDVYDLEPGRGIQSLRGLAASIDQATITPDGKRAAALARNWQAAVWDVDGARLLLRVDAPRAMYAEHADIRLSDDGQFLVIASGWEARRWRIPKHGEKPGEPDVWPLNAALGNIVRFTEDGKLLVCRYETSAGGDLIRQSIPWTKDERCVRIYELTPRQKPHEVAAKHDLPTHIFRLHGAPDGSFFIADGMTKEAKDGHALFAYRGATGERMWRIDLPKFTVNTSASTMDSSGRVLQYYATNEQMMLATLPDLHPPTEPADIEELPAFGRAYVFRRSTVGDLTLDLSRPGLGQPLVRLNIDGRLGTVNGVPFTPDGTRLIWGNTDGVVHVGDLPEVRKRLSAVGLGWR
jgi:serine/threonine protein kinase/WD40 repeat protein